MNILPPCGTATLDSTPDAGFSIDFNYGSSIGFTPAWTVSEPTCPVEYTCSTIVGAPDFCTPTSNAETTITFDGTTGTLQFATSDQTTYPHGTYEIRI